jgi:hypothetical protein
VEADRRLVMRDERRETRHDRYRMACGLTEREINQANAQRRIAEKHEVCDLCSGPIHQIHDAGSLLASEADREEPTQPRSLQVEGDLGAKAYGPDPGNDFFLRDRVQPEDKLREETLSRRGKVFENFGVRAEANHSQQSSRFRGRWRS